MIRPQRAARSRMALLLGTLCLLAAAGLLVGVWRFVASPESGAKKAAEEFPLLPDSVAEIPFDRVSVSEREGEFGMELDFTQPWSEPGTKAALVARVRSVRDYAARELAHGYPESIGRRCRLRLHSEQIPDALARRLMVALARELEADQIGFDVFVEQTPLSLGATQPERQPADFVCRDPESGGDLFVIVVWRPWKEVLWPALKKRIERARGRMRAIGTSDLRLCFLHWPNDPELLALRELRDRLEAEGLRFSIESVAPGREEILALGAE